MRILLIALSLMLTAGGAFSQNILKAIEKKFDNGKPEVIAYYEKEIEASNLVKKEIFEVDGKKIEEQNYKGGILHGKSTKWKAFDGSVEWETNYENGQKHGVQKEFFSDGQIKTELNYLKGKMDGEQKGFYLKDHAQRFIFNLSGGIYHGAQEENNPDGSRKYRLNFVAGKMDGIQRWYLPPNGDVKEERWKQGQLEEAVESHTASQPKVARIFEFKTGDPEALTVSGEKVLVKEMGYYPSGAIQYITEMGENPSTKMLHLSGQTMAQGAGGIGSEQGKWTFYYPDGKKWKQGEFEKGQKNGNWTIWNEKEQVIFEELWKTGNDARGEKFLRFSCKVIFYYPDGKIESEGFLDPIDRKNGNWIFHYSNGSVKREESYLANCKEPGATPFAETITAYDEEGRKTIEGSARKQTHFEYHGNNKVKIETEYLFPCHDRCNKETYEYYQDGAMKRNATLKVNGQSCNMDEKIMLKRIEYRESGDKVAVDSYNDQGVIEGVQEGWYNNGTKRYEYTYKAGKPEGAVKEWYDTGQIKLDLVYQVVDGRVVELKSGTFYSDNGKGTEYNQADGKELKKKAQEVLDLSFWKEYMGKH